MSRETINTEGERAMDGGLTVEKGNVSADSQQDKMKTGLRIAEKWFYFARS